MVLEAIQKLMGNFNKRNMGEEAVYASKIFKSLLEQSKVSDIKIPEYRKWELLVYMLHKFREEGLELDQETMIEFFEYMDSKNYNVGN